MPVRDPRFRPLSMVWGVGKADAPDVRLVASWSEYQRAEPSLRRGHLWSLDPEPWEGERTRRMPWGYLAGVPRLGMEVFQSVTTRIGDTDVWESWFAYPGSRAQTDILGRTRIVTQGKNTVRFNLAAGGAIDGWSYDGVQLLNRGKMLGRGINHALEWADVAGSRLTRHCPNQACSHYRIGEGAQGGVLVTFDEKDHPLGGKVVTTRSVPIEMDPDGKWSVPGISTDHGGGLYKLVLWHTSLLTVETWIDYQGQDGLHRIRATWSLPRDVVSYWFETTASTAVTLQDRFDEVKAYDASTGATTDLGAIVDAVEDERLAISRSGTWRDGQPSPSGTAPVPGGWGCVYARDSANDLAVALPTRLDPIATGTDLTLPETGSPTWWSAMTRRLGSTGEDGDQMVMLGLDDGFTSRWHDATSKRALPKNLEVTRWLSMGSLASIRKHAASLPA